MKSTYRLIVVMVLAIALCSGCNRKEAQNTIDPAKTEQSGKGLESPPSTAGLRIAVGGMITPKEGFAYYREFLDYIASKTGEPVHYIDAENYEVINKKLMTGEIDAGFVCSGPYVDGKKEFGLELLAAPRAYGKTTYFSYIIAPRGSKATSIYDLKGKSFAFTDPLSNTGKLVPEYMLKSKGESPEKFFGKLAYSGSHDKSISAVNKGLVDGASVDSLIWEYANRTRPEQTANTTIIQKSDPYAIPPFVVRPGLPAAVKEKLAAILLNAHNDPKGKAILDKMMIDRFEKIEDSAYDTIRDMKRLTEKP